MTQQCRQMLRVRYRADSRSSARNLSSSRDTSPTWNTYVLNIISRIMITLNRMAMSWILQYERGGTECIKTYIKSDTHVQLIYMHDS